MPEENRPESEELSSPSIELSVVMPCLDEAETLPICLEKAFSAMREADVHGEVILSLIHI